MSGVLGPKGPRTALRVRDRVLELRAADRSVTEIAAAMTAAGTPVSAQTVWSILAAEGLERLPRRDRTGTGAPPRAAAAKAQVVRTWPAGTALASDFAGLFLLLPAMVELGVEELVRGAGYPGTSVLRAFHSLGSLLLAKCARRPRASHVEALAADPGLGLSAGADRAAQGYPPDQLLLPGAPGVQREAARRPGAPPA